MSCSPVVLNNAILAAELPPAGMGEIGKICDLNFGNYRISFLKLETNIEIFQIEIVPFSLV
jgi:hypothetical protein